VFKVSSVKLESRDGINIMSCTKNITERYINHGNLTKSVFSKSPVEDSKLSFVQSISLTSLAGSEQAYPVATTYDNLMYHPQSENVEVSTYTELVAGLDEVSLKYSTNYVVAIRQILTLSTLLSTSRLN